MYRMIKVPDDLPEGQKFVGLYQGDSTTSPPTPPHMSLWTQTDLNRMVKNVGSSTTPDWQVIDTAATPATTTTPGVLKTSTAQADPVAVTTNDAGYTQAVAHKDITSGNPHNTTADAIGAATTGALNAHEAKSVDPASTDTTRDKHVANNDIKVLEDHRNATNNPHATTAAQVGAPTSADLSAHTGNTTNPHAVTHAQTSPAAVDPASTDTARTKHLSDADAKSWEDHRNATTAAHGGIVASTDSRLTDARTPTGSAGGDLAGTYPNPTLAEIGTAETVAYPASITRDAKGRITAWTPGTPAGVPLASVEQEGVARLSSNPPAGEVPVVYRVGDTPAGVVPDTRLISTAAPLAGGGDGTADRTLSINAATESAQGSTRYATNAQAQAGTAIDRAVHPAGLKAAITPEAWIAPTLLNGWVNFGTPAEVAGYRKTPWGEVQLRGRIKSGTTTDATVLLTLPTGYRPAASRDFVSVQGNNGSCRIIVNSAGDVSIVGVTNNAFLSLESVRFDVV